VFLKSKGAIDAKSSRAKLVTLHGAKLVCLQLSLPNSFANSFHNPKEGVAIAVAAGQPPAVAGMPQTISMVSAFTSDPSKAPELQTSLLDTLPLSNLTSEQLSIKRFNLKKAAGGKAQLRAVMAQINQYKPWRTDLIRLSRPGWVQRLQLSSSWKPHEREIIRFMGYLYTFQGVQQPRLEHYLNGTLVMQYIGFLKERGLNPSSLSTNLHTAKVVSEWVWQSQHVGQPSEQMQPLYSQYQSVLDHLNAQCRHNLTIDPAKLERQQEAREQKMAAISPEQLCVLIEDVRLQAVRQVADLVVGETEDEKRQAAIEVMHAAMLTFFFGYMPPIRESIVISLQMPDYKGPCLHLDCQHPNTCKGNRLTWIGDEGNKTLELIAPHHKQSGKPCTSNPEPLRVELPEEMCRLVEPHIIWGRKLIIDDVCAADEVESVPPLVFIWPSTCKAILPQQVSQLFNKVVLSVAEVKFGPQWCRSLFVAERRAPDRIECGMSDEAAAMIMNNSISAWNAAYDKQRSTRFASEVQQGMPQWRAELLAKGKEELKNQPRKKKKHETVVV
jgi:hypothetical protein